MMLCICVCLLFWHLQLQYQAMGLFDSFEEDMPHSPSAVVPTINVEELFDDPKYVSSTAIQVCIQHMNASATCTARNGLDMIHTPDHMSFSTVSCQI